ncbi:MAG: hypothetical protein R2779_05595 [Crocinitomicaceae bacterium]
MQPSFCSTLVFWLVGSITSPQIADWMLLKGHSEYIILLLSIVCIDAVAAALPFGTIEKRKQGQKLCRSFNFIHCCINIISNVGVISLPLWKWKSRQSKE